MRIFYIPAILLALLILSNKSLTAQRTCDHTITGNVLMIDGSSGIYKPGDNVCLQGSHKEYLLIQNVHGTAEQPITFINKDSAIIINTDNYYGIKVAHCSNIIVSGNGVDGIKYGFQVERVANGTGLAVGELSTDVEIEFMEIANTPIAGVYAKTDPTCNDFSATRDKFTMYNFKFHDCYVHDVADEGLYIGSSKYSGQHLTGQCDTLVYPHVLVGTRIYNNIIENTGWDGIQVSSAEHDCRVYNNTIRNDSYAGWPGQMSGMLIGGGSRCEIYNNKIYDGKGDGIDVFGLGSTKLFNNLIVRAGRTYQPNDPVAFKHGIYLGKSVSESDEVNKIYNNTVISPKSFGITYANDENKMGYIINNAVINPGYTDAGESAFINISVDESLVEVSNTYSNNSADAAKFVDVNNDNYDLKATSPLVDKGMELVDEGIVFDINSRVRPFHTYTDIGAYECQDPHISITENHTQPAAIFPNPADAYFSIYYDIPIKKTTIEIFDMQGKKVKKAIESVSPIKQKFDTSNLPDGIYTIAITFDGKIETYHLAIIHE